MNDQLRCTCHTRIPCEKCTEWAHNYMNNQDIVTELRKWADAPIKSPAISKALREGANEIERLRAQTLQSDTNIVRTPQERSTEEIVERVLALNHPDAADAADEIERLQDLILDQSDKIEDLRYKISKIQKKLQETVIEAYRG